MNKENYKVQNGCHNCKSCIIDRWEEDPWEYYCNYDNSSHKMWWQNNSNWLSKNKVDSAGYCSNWEERN